MGKHWLSRPGHAIAVLKHLRRQVELDAVSESAALLAYYILFALFPFLFALVALLAYLPWVKTEVAQTLDRLSVVMPASAFQLVHGHLQSLLWSPRPHFLGLGGLTALWSASRGVNAGRKALNRAFRVKETRGIVHVNAIALALTLSALLLVPLSLAGMILGGRVGEWLWSRFGLGGPFRLFWPYLRWPITGAAVLFSLALAYFALPNAKRRFRYFSPGAVCATLLWLAITWGFTQYTQHFGRFNLTYGSIGGVMVLLIWFYLSGWAFVFGGELDATLERERERQRTP